MRPKQLPEKAKWDNLTYGKCTCEMTVLTGGSVKVHWITDIRNGTVTSIGPGTTLSCSTIFGKVHCIYKTNGTDLGTLTGGATERRDIEKSTIPWLTTNSLCAEKAEWSAKYEIAIPKPFVASHT